MTPWRAYLAEARFVLRHSWSDWLLGLVMLGVALLEWRQPQWWWIPIRAVLLCSTWLNLRSALAWRQVWDARLAAAALKGRWIAYARSVGLPEPVISAACTHLEAGRELEAKALFREHARW